MTTRFAIVSMGRSGSTFLGALLDSHPDMTCAGEVIAPWQDYGQNHADRDIGEYLEEAVLAGCEVGGFKMPWDWLLCYPDAWGAFRRHGYRIVFLRRANKVDQFLSLKLAQRNGQWKSEGRYGEQSVAVDPAELAEWVGTAIYTDYLLRQMCRRYPRIEVTYEEVAAGRRWGEMQDFLGVRRAALSPGTVRGRTVPRREAIANWDEVAAAATGALREQLMAPEG